MSGPFVCGMRKFDKHKMSAPERPSNNVLYQENQKSLSDLIKQREQQDKGIFTPIPHISQIQPSIVSPTPNNAIVYTPWKTPSSSV